MSLEDLPEAIDAKFDDIREMPAQTEEEKIEKDRAA
jgi:hypothetical protein